MGKKQKIFSKNFKTRKREHDEYINAGNENMTSNNQGKFKNAMHMMDFDIDTNIVAKLKGNEKNNRVDRTQVSTWNYDTIIHSEENIIKIKETQMKSQLASDENEDMIDPSPKEEKNVFEKDNEQDNVNMEKFEGEVYAKDCSFSDFNLSKLIIKALAVLEYFTPTKVQEKVIPLALKGHDILINSETGSGKTACFLLPILQKIISSRGSPNISRALIIVPTRELALQCNEMLKHFSAYLDITYVFLCGGMSIENQSSQLKTNPEIIIATPGRLIDMLYNYNLLSLENICILVLDEADKLLELGFKDAIMEILELIKDNPQRQTMLFSATLNPKIIDLGKHALKNPIKIKLAQSAILRNLKQYICRMRFKKLEFTQDENEFEKRMAYLIHIIKNSHLTRTIIFFNTKKECHKALLIFNSINLSAAELHADVPQNERLKSLDNFQKNKVKFLLATDIAGRGIDIEKVKCVVNFQMPLIADRYTHRVGRTARKGYLGEAITICNDKDRLALKKFMRKEKFTLMPMKIENSAIKILYKNLIKDKQTIEDRLQTDFAEKELLLTEKDVEKSINMTLHKEEIYNKPRKQWYEGKNEKKEKKKQMKEEFNKQKSQLFEDI